MIEEITGLSLKDERLTPNLLAEKAAAILPRLLAQRDAAKSKRERKVLSARIRSARLLLKWAKSRAGYVCRERRRPPAVSADQAFVARTIRFGAG